MKLNSKTKHAVQVGDVLTFDYGDSYRVFSVHKGTDKYGNVRSISFGLTCLDGSGRHIYGMASSECYGAEINCKHCNGNDCELSECKCSGHYDDMKQCAYCTWSFC